MFSISRLLVLSGIALTLALPSIAQARDLSNVRAAHMVVRKVNPADVERFGQLAAKHGFNTVVLALSSDTIRFDALSRIRNKRQWSAGQLRQVVRSLKDLGLEVVPELKLLTHQEKFLSTHYPELMFNTVTYESANPVTHKLVYSVIDEVLEITEATSLHIGHDEVVGWKPAHARKILGKNGVPLPSNKFLLDIKAVHAYLSGKNIQTWMWGDMLIGPSEHPVMLERHLHGVADGYGALMRRLLPKDIVICDWHYFDDQSDFPSIDTFRNDGFKVLGAVWKKASTTKSFTNYAAKNKASGMIATTWWHVQKGEWGIVEQILKQSASAFNREFADE